MTLTELRYVVAIARHRHFARAAEACFVSQPSLSIAIRKLEDELGVRLFERNRNEVIITPAGEAIVEQAQIVIREAERINELAAATQDPLGTTLRLGVIYTVGPHLVPYLIPSLRKQAPNLSLIVRENFTDALAGELLSGDIDIAIMSLPFQHPRLVSRPLYEEPFLAAVPLDHKLSRRKRITTQLLDNERLLLLGARNCFRDQVLEICPNCISEPAAERDEIQTMLESSSLETICQMVASGAGVTVLPATIQLNETLRKQLALIPFSRPEPTRTIAAFYRRGFARPELVNALATAVQRSRLKGVRMTD